MQLNLLCGARSIGLTSQNLVSTRHSAYCKYCNQMETGQHHLLKCLIAELRWCKIESVLEKLSDQPLDNEEKIFGLIDEPKKSKAYLRNFITFTIRHTILNNRLNSLHGHSLTSLAEKHCEKK